MDPPPCLLGTLVGEGTGSELACPAFPVSPREMGNLLKTLVFLFLNTCSPTSDPKNQSSEHTMKSLHKAKNRSKIPRITP